MAGVELPDAAIARMIGEVVDIIVQIEQRAGYRYVSEVLKIERYCPATDDYEYTVWA